jgi:hypothetical protein
MRSEKRWAGKVTREAGPMKHGTTGIAFVEDPDGLSRSSSSSAGRAQGGLRA